MIFSFHLKEHVWDLTLSDRNYGNNNVPYRKQKLILDVKAVVAGPAGLVSAGPLFWPSMLSAVTSFSRFGSLYFVLTIYRCNYQ